VLSLNLVLEEHLYV